MLPLYTGNFKRTALEAVSESLRRSGGIMNSHTCSTALVDDLEEQLVWLMAWQEWLGEKKP